MNTRRLAERVTPHLAERLETKRCARTRQSSRKVRLTAEEKIKAGN